MDELKKILTKDNPYAINILVNLVDKEMENANGEYLTSLKDIVKKLLGGGNLT